MTDTIFYNILFKECKYVQLENEPFFFITVYISYKKPSVLQIV